MWARTTRSALFSARRTARDQPPFSEMREAFRLPMTLERLTCLKLTSYSTLKSTENSGEGFSLMRDMSGERCSGLRPGPYTEDE